MIDLVKLAQALKAAGMDCINKTAGVTNWPHLVVWIPAADGLGGDAARWEGTGEHPPLLVAMLDVLEAAGAVYCLMSFRHGGDAKFKFCAYQGLTEWARESASTRTAAVALALIAAREAGLLPTEVPK